MPYFKRFRYRRIDETTRMKYRETFLSKGDFILPLFLVEKAGYKEEIASMPGVYHLGVDACIDYLKPLIEAGLKSVILFSVPGHKGVKQAWDPNGIVQNAVPRIKSRFPALEIISDVCICSFTPDGHCHIGDNDKTCEILARIALSHALAGVDIVAPSDMMDGRVAYIKESFNQNGLNTKIMSYAAKYASSFYGPFREATDCAPTHGDRKSYQMDPANSDEALLEIQEDLKEGSDAYIVKPALPYLDIIRRASERFKAELIAYNVSGEYSMLRLLIENHLAKEDIIRESLISIKRAGADRIISYFTPYVLGWLS